MRIMMIICFSALFSNIALSQVGTIPGELIVQNGSVQYQIPISLPEGRGSNTPQIALEYSSQNLASGIVGSGFSVSGLSAISRCGMQISIDGYSQAMTNSAQDNFCLDGARLILSKGQKGSNGSEYRPHIDDFSKVVLNKNALSANSFFQVFTKGGDVLTYGKQFDNSLWLLTKVDDRTGKNSIVYSYNDKAQIDNIAYDKYKINFVYQPYTGLTGQHTSYLNRTNNTVRKTNTLLDTIQIRLNGRLKNYYKIKRKGISSKDTSSVYGQLISAIEYCDRRGNCLPETQFEWHSDRPFDTYARYWLPTWGKTVGGQSGNSFIDVDGDQAIDYCRVAATNKLECQFDFAQNGAQNKQEFLLSPTLNKSYWWGWTDFNGDGKKQLCRINSGQFVCTQFGVNGLQSNIRFTLNSLPKSSKQTWIFDFTGNGLPDICRITSAGSLVCSENTNGRALGKTHIYRDLELAPDSYMWWADIDGNGFQDFCRATNRSTNAELTCTRFNATQVIGPKPEKLPIKDLGKYETRRWWLDINGDGAADFCRNTGSKSGNGSNITCSLGSLSNITHFDQDIVLKGGSDWQGNWSDSQSQWWLDTNKDGQIEFCRLITSTMHCTSMAGETSVFPLSVSGNPNMGSASRRWFMDLDGDGQIEYCRNVNNTSGASSALDCQVIDNQTYSPSLLKSVTNGLGFTSHVDYDHHQNIGVPDWPSKLRHPYAAGNKNTLLVSKITSDNGVGGKSYTEFYYGPSRYHLHGEGHSGFAWVKQREYRDEDNYARGREIYYRTDYPFTQSVSKSKEYLLDMSQLKTDKWDFSSAKLLNQSDTTYSVSSIGRLGTINNPASIRYTISIPQQIDTSYDLNGQTLSTVTTNNTSIDAFGNVGRTSVSTSGVNPLSGRSETFITQTHNQYHNNESKWLLGRLTVSKVTHIAPDGERSVRQTNFSYDANTGYLASEVVEPNHQLSVTKRYQRNDEGVITGTQTTAWNGQENQTRSEAVQLAYSGDSVIQSSTNAMGFLSSIITSRYTGTSTAKDINNLKTITEYDGFGRVIKSRSQAKVGYNDTTIQYYPISSRHCIHKPQYAVYCVVSQTSGLGKKIVYFDSLQRELRTAQLGLDSRWIVKDSIYNSKAQLYKVSRPYFIGESPQFSTTHYDALGRVTSISDPGPAGQKNSLIRNQYGVNWVKQFDALGRATTTYFNAKGWEVKVAQPHSANLVKNYSPTGKLISVTGAGGATITNRYDDFGNKVFTNDPDLGLWHYSYNGFGELISQTDAKGQTTQSHYDQLGRLVTKTVETKDNDGKVTKRTSNWVYDSYGNNQWYGALLKAQTPDTIKTRTFDTIGQLANEQLITDQHTFTRSFTYNNLGQVTQESRPNNFKLNFDYDKATGVATGIWGNKSQFSVHFSQEEYRNVIQPLLVEAMQRATQYLDRATELIEQVQFYDKRIATYQALIDKTMTVSGDSEEIVAQVNGKPLAVYEHWNGVKYLKIPDTLILIPSSPLLTSSMPADFYLKLEGDALSKVSLDEWRHVQAQLTPTGHQVFYDRLNGQGMMVSQEVIDEIPETYDDATLSAFERLRQYAQDIERLEYVQNNLHQQAQSYVQAAEQLIILSEQTQLIADRYKAMSSDSLQEYDSLNALSSTDFAAGKVYYWRLNGLDAEGRVRSEVYGNGLTNVYDYHEGTGQLLSINTLSGNKTLRQLHYIYDRMNNVTQRSDLVNHVKDSYQYDHLNRLTNNTLSGLSGKHQANPIFNKSYRVNYNKAGNIVFKTGVGSYQYTDSKHRHAVTKAGSKSYTYDANGNMLSGDGRNISWNGFNKPTKISQANRWVSFAYDENRQRYLKQNQTGDKTWYLDKAYERVDLANGEVEHKQFVYAAGKLVAVNIDRKKSNAKGQAASFDRQIRFTHSDALGSHDLITDIWGNIVERKSYDAWGKARAFEWERGTSFVEQALLTNRGYTGHEQLEEVDLIHMNGRLYDATLARFISADTFVPAPSDSQSFNRYSYVHNNPMKYTDPSGHFLKKLFKEIGRAFKRIGNFIKESWRTLATVAISFIAPYAAPFLLGVSSLTAAQTIMVGFVAGSLGGAITGRSFKSALIGGISGAMFGALHQFNPSGLQEGISKVAAHGMAGGASSVMQGGSFGEGFLSAAVMQSISLGPAGEAMNKLSSHNFGNMLYNAVASATIGGTVSVLTGGKFKNGAVSGAFSRMLNDMANYDLTPAIIKERSRIMNLTPEEYNQKMSPMGYLGGETNALLSREVLSEELRVLGIDGVEEKLISSYTKDIGNTISKDVVSGISAPVRWGIQAIEVIQLMNPWLTEKQYEFHYRCQGYECNVKEIEEIKR